MPPKVKKYLVVIGGPTGVGKTRIAIDLAKTYNTVIVSADSRQLYREMNIGTAKPTPEERAQVPHYLIDYVSIKDEYSAGGYARACKSLLQELFTERDIIFMVGGSGLYIRAVIDGFDEMPVVPKDIREKWKQIYTEKGIGFLQQEVTILDPEYAAKVDMENPHRLVRALSLMEVSNTPISILHRNVLEQRPFEVIRILCNLPRQELYDRIRNRVDEMISAGLINEVRSLLPYKDTQAMQTVGYKEIVSFLDGHLTQEEAIAKIKQHSCNYAKRQLTWFRHQGEWREFNPPEVDDIHHYIKSKSK
jgi:tRNA dimethylallyltransferase